MASAPGNYIDRVAFPKGGVVLDAPEVGPHLGLFHRGVDLLKKRLHGLGDLAVGMWRTIPVVDDAVLRRAGHGTLHANVVWLTATLIIPTES